MKKVLYIATSDIHLSIFHRPYIQWLAENGAQVDLVYENRGGNTFEAAKNIFYLNFPRSVFRKSLLKSYKGLKEIIDEGNYDIVHCHTPIPSMLTRLASMAARRKKTKVLYTVHGFHFYKGAPLSRWMFYYPIEYALSYFTDAIITINGEDYQYTKGKMGQKEALYIRGVGVDSTRFKPLSNGEKNVQRLKHGWKENDFILMYVAEFIPRKNHEFIIRSLALMIQKIPNLKIVFAGNGILLNKMKQLSKELQLQNHIEFLGFRKDVGELFPLADITISSSKQEGLPINLVEGMMCGLPVVANDVRGHHDLITSGENGFMFNSGNTEEFADYIQQLYEDEELRSQMGLQSLARSKDFELSASLKSMTEIYKKYLA